MKHTCLSLLALCGTASIGHAAAPLLHDYSDATVVVLDEICTEASGVAYDPDTDSLFVIGDEGANVVETYKTGEVKSFMPLQNFNSSADPEDITYLGNGRFMLALERTRRGYFIDYVAGQTCTRINNTGPIFTGDGSVIDNTGLEGVCYDPIDNSVWGVKERDPLSVYEMRNFDSDNYAVTAPFPGSRFSRVNATSTSSVYILANCKAFAADDPRRQNVLFLCRDDEKILEMTRTGDLVDTLDLSFLKRNSIEGITMDNDGVMYLVSEEIPSAGEGKNARMIIMRPKNDIPVVRGQSFAVSEENGGMTATLTWTTTIGSSYVMEYSSDFVSWQVVSDAYLATTDSMTGTSIPVAKGPQGYFRVRKLGQ
jgi:uncharacterized protein YjiK